MVGKGDVVIVQCQLVEGILVSYPRQVIHHDTPLLELQDIHVSKDKGITHPTPYKLVIGSLMYLVSGSPPELAFSVNFLAQKLMKPTKKHWDLLTPLIGYLIKTWDCGINLLPEFFSLNLWSDAGWGGNLEHLQCRLLLKLGNKPVLWASKQQAVVTLSMCTDKYIPLSN
ncbi:hypothetical protein O181_087786 [Austropuccinia psidii MF-1]|uniref:Uncharacterized protein n=1 Tax=Austropuccinia psidii MF-1 TaxID=1389203 RepID=A0A9Q3IQB7_9BASI|nr:hypothetical protein [Austropuccinia psidii MF-1]